MCAVCLYTFVSVCYSAVLLINERVRMR